MMKMIRILLLIVVACSDGYSQEPEEPKIKHSVQIKPYFLFGFNVPIQFGDTALATAHSSNVGFVAELGLLTYRNFYAGVGSNMHNYTVQNRQIMGNYYTSKHNSYYGFISYEFPSVSKFSLAPSIGYGFSELVMKKGGSRRGKQSGEEFRIGTAVIYNLNKTNAVCLTIYYINNNYAVNTTESLQDFFGKSNQIQIALAYKF